MAAELQARPSVDDEKVLQRLPKHVECIAYYIGGGRYRAICLDFSLIAESDQSVLDAANRLQAQIEDYVGDVIDQGCPRHLIDRGFTFWERLPLRLMIAGVGLLGIVSSWIHRQSDSATWRQSVPCAA